VAYILVADIGHRGWKRGTITEGEKKSRREWRNEGRQGGKYGGREGGKDES
jgi:hypothetical protein